MTARTLRLAALALVCAVLACSGGGDEPTQVLVVIDAEGGVRDRAAELRITVQPGGDETPVYERTLSRARSQIVLPYVLALVPKDGDASRRFEVVATVYDDDDDFVAQVRAISGYVRNRRVVLWLLLEDSCEGRSCDPGETCHRGECESATVDPDTLEPLDDVELPDTMPITPGGPDQDAGEAGSGEAGSSMAGSGMSGSGGTSGDNAGRGGTSGAAGAGTGGSGGGESGASGAAAGEGGSAGGPPPACNDGDEQACGSSEGECSPGTQTCTEGEWGACSGEVIGTSEQCDGEDDDCDGNTDEQATCNAADLPHASVAACFVGSCRAITCQSQWADCNLSRSDGCEQTLTTLQYCGSCFGTCAIANASESCATGTCRVASCDAGWDDCDANGTSCETQLGTIDDCSACGDSCSYAHGNAACANNAGVRSCRFTGCTSSRYASCDNMDATGCEVDLQTDANHCGACNNDCEAKPNVASAACVNSECAFDCTSDYIDCDGNPSNGCEHDYSMQGLCSRCFQSGTSNFAASTYTYTTAVAFNCGGTHTFNSTTQTWDTNCCGTCPSPSLPVAQTAAGGPQVVILRATSLQVAAGTTLRLVGQYPVIFAVNGDATIAGVIDASATGSVAGAGGNWSCGAATGGNSSGGYDTFGSSGGGGGGFGTSGGLGGTGDWGTPGVAGAMRGNAALSPLLGGCGGGEGGDCPGAPVGAGGGAFQISAAGSLTVSGTLRANGGAGTLGCGDAGGGSGGGSGGAILLEASLLQTSSALLLASGGAGGPGAAGPAGGPGSTSSSAAGAPGMNDTFDGGSGGGGGYGRVSQRDCLAP